MLHELIVSNRLELTRRCKEKVAKRFDPSRIPAAMDHCVSLFLQQLIDTLRRQELMLTRSILDPEPTPSRSTNESAVSMHVGEMLRLGFTVDQVVDEYDDFCQSVTDLAAEENVVITNDGFRTISRCLDGVIADAITSLCMVQTLPSSDRNIDTALASAVNPESPVDSCENSGTSEGLGVRCRRWNMASTLVTAAHCFALAVVIWCVMVSVLRVVLG